MATICEKIFREYDIRGVVGPEITEDGAFLIGKAFGSVVKEAKGARVCVGRDGRLSSPALFQQLTQGLLTTGVTVIDVGIGPTPYTNFCARHLDTDAMMMVTGSHNPGDQNGFKMALFHKAFWGEQVRALKDRIDEERFVQGDGIFIAQALQEAYVDYLVKDFKDHYSQGRPLTVAWDPGNGAGGDIVEALTKRIPAHHPDPTVAKNLVELQALVKEKDCDLGLAFDGDADRLGVVDGDGTILWGDEFMELFAKEVLLAKPGARIIADVKASETLFDAVRAMGGDALMWKTGHSLIKTKMYETGSPLAGELSGHIFFADRYFGFDDALYAGLRLLGICATSDQSLARWNRARPKRFGTPELRLPCVTKDRFDVVKEVGALARKQGLAVDETDGVRVKNNHGWWLVRASNTQDLLVARAESLTPEGLEVLVSTLKELLIPHGVSFDA
jgi:phosphomannomutase